MRRDLHDHRLHVYGCDQQALIAGLQDYLIGRDNKQITAGRFRPQRQVIRLGVPEVVNLSPTRLAQWFEHAERARDTWQNCREILIALGDDRLPKITHLADAPAPNDAATQALWAFTAQYAQLQQLLALLLHDSVVLVPSGLGQLASCCASGALSLTQALGWLKRDLMQPVPATAVYHVTCECSTGVNPGLETLVWTHDEQAWLQRLAANGAALQLVLNSDGRIVADNALHVMPPDGGSFLQFLSVLGLRANVSWQTLAVRSALKLPAYPWQRQSYWLPRPERNAAPASAPAVLVAVTDNSNLCRELSVMSLADQETRLRTYLRERVAAALHMPIEGVTIAQPVDTLGMDSLTAVEIKNRIERDLHITIPVVKFLNGYSVADCAAFLLAELSAKPPSNVPGHVAGASITALPTVASPTVLQPESDIERQIAAMSSAQVDAMLELLMHEST
jgi:acyl transferase domain-containing protein